MSRVVKSRLRKVEEKTRPKGAKLYVVWGRDEAEVERLITDARKAGVLRPEDKPEASVWRLPSEMPRSRWTTLDEMSGEELDERIRVLNELICAQTGKEPHEAREEFIRWARENGYGEIASLMEKGELP